VGALLVTLAIVAAVGSRTEVMRALVVETLTDRLGSDVQLESFSVDTFPSVHVYGTGLAVRIREAGEAPPLVSVKSFSIRGGLLGMLGRTRQFSSVTVDGLEINVPPDGSAMPEGLRREGDASEPSRIHIRKLYANDALLRLIPAKEGKRPREFLIHRLEMDGVGAEERMPFRAELTNPVPVGLIRTEGRFGPWVRDAPGGTPLDGTYLFANADLSTIKGIGGNLTSTGDFGGTLGHISVTGTTETPDFYLSHANNRVPLTTRFEAIVDGTDGDTYLKAVEARLDQTPIHASGAVAGVPKGEGRRVQLDVRIADGRIEDLLHLAVKGERPPIVGRVALRTAFDLPPGPGDVIERLRLRGQFDLSSARFTDRGVTDKLAGMSARARGEDPEDASDRVLTDLEGRFAVGGGTVSLSDLRFALPGAVVQLSGTYGLRSEEINFDGTLRMDATVSEAANLGGIRGFLLKAVDPLFRKKGAGAVLPIKVRGTREEPKFGLDVLKAITPR